MTWPEPSSRIYPETTFVRGSCPKHEEAARRNREKKKRAFRRGIHPLPAEMIAGGRGEHHGTLARKGMFPDLPYVVH
jgi:hypothetical protein